MKRCRQNNRSFTLRTTLQLVYTVQQFLGDFFFLQLHTVLTRLLQLEVDLHGPGGPRAGK